MDKEKTYSVCELFSSVSGEGITTGFPAVFVRVGGCNLRCSYCDTDYAQQAESLQYRDMTVAEIVAEVKKQKIRQVICTGGEPLWGRNRDLPLELAKEGFYVRVETNGSMPLYSDEERDSVHTGRLEYALDIKCPSSQMEQEDLLRENLKLLRRGDELKFIVGDQPDFYYALEKIKTCKERLVEKEVLLNFSCVFGALSYQQLCEMLLKESSFFYQEGLWVRLNLQIHKMIWSPNARGV